MNSTINNTEKKIYKFLHKNGTVYRKEYIIEEVKEENGYKLKGNYTEKELLFFKFGLPTDQPFIKHIDMVLLKDGELFKNSNLPVLSYNASLYYYKEIIERDCVHYVLSDKFDSDSSEDMEFLDWFAEIIDELKFGDFNDLTTDELR